MKPPDFDAQQSRAEWDALSRASSTGAGFGWLQVVGQAQHRR
jgi:hypothetical protein